MSAELIARLQRSPGSRLCLATGALVTTVSCGLALARTLPADVPAAATLGLSALVLALNGLGLRLAGNPGPVALESAMTMTGLAVLGPFLTACAWAGSGWVLLIWSSLLCTGALGGAAWWSRDSAVGSRSNAATADAALPHASLSAPVDESEFATQTEPSLLQDGLQQRMVRRIADGCESIEVAWRIDFAPGQQLQSLHLPISPALASAPEVECEPLEGTEVDVTVGAVHTFGVRLDVRRSGDARSPANAVLGVHLRSATRAA